MSSRSSYAQLRPTSHPNASALRSRAAALRMFAETLEGLLVNRLDGATDDDVAPTGQRDHAYLCRTLLRYNLQQLHLAADDLRDVAHRMCQDAHVIELARRVATPQHPAL